MSRRIEAFARRVQSDPAFLAAPLAALASGEHLDDAGLAALLGCPVETLPLLRLCGRPRAGPLFRQDVGRIAAHFDLDPVALAEALRRAEALEALRRDQAPARGTLLAARDDAPSADDAEPAP